MIFFSSLVETRGVNASEAPDGDGFCLNALRIITGLHGAASSQLEAQLGAQQKPQHRGKKILNTVLLGESIVVADFLYLFFYILVEHCYSVVAFSTPSVSY